MCHFAAFEAYCNGSVEPSQHKASQESEQLGKEVIGLEQPMRDVQLAASSAVRAMALQQLDLSATQVADADLEHLKGLPRLAAPRLLGYPGHRHGRQDVCHGRWRGTLEGADGVAGTQLRRSRLMLELTGSDLAA
jgi:hypothetical protein